MDAAESPKKSDSRRPNVPPATRELAVQYLMAAKEAEITAIENKDVQGAKEAEITAIKNWDVKDAAAGGSIGVEESKCAEPSQSAASPPQSAASPQCELQAQAQPQSSGSRRSSAGEPSWRGRLKRASTASSRTARGGPKRQRGPVDN